MTILSSSTRPSSTTLSAARLHRWGTLLGVALVVLLILGSSWDGDWHGRVGRDDFWIPPHLMMYSSIALFGVIALGITVWSTSNLPHNAPGMLRLFGVQAPIGIALMGIGVLVAMSAAPFDDLWHRTFGIDVSVWSPPHFTGWSGFALSFIGVQVAIVRQWPQLIGGRGAVTRIGLIAFAIVASGMLRLMTIATLPGVSYSIWNDTGQLQEVPIIHPFLFALAASVFMVPTLSALYRLANRRGLILSLLGLVLLAAVAIVFVEIFTPILREARGEAWRTAADDTSTRDLFLIPTLFTILPGLAALFFRAEHSTRIGALAACVYWVQLAVYRASSGAIEIGSALGGLVLCIGVGALLGHLGGRLAVWFAKRTT